MAGTATQLIERAWDEVYTSFHRRFRLRRTDTHKSVAFLIRFEDVRILLKNGDMMSMLPESVVFSAEREAHIAKLAAETVVRAAFVRMWSDLPPIGASLIGAGKSSELLGVAKQGKVKSFLDAFRPLYRDNSTATLGIVLQDAFLAMACPSERPAPILLHIEPGMPDVVCTVQLRQDSDYTRNLLAAELREFEYWINYPLTLILACHLGANASRVMSGHDPVLENPKEVFRTIEFDF